jgi:hypothetical protein
MTAIISPALLLYKRKENFLTGIEMKKEANQSIPAPQP